MNSKPVDAAFQGIARLRRIMARLRMPESGCPWDIEQNFGSIAPHTIEEAYEVADAIERKDMPSLMGELGDLLFQVVYHAQMAEELDEFGLDEVIDGICEKMVRRHPHVFGEAVVQNAEAQTVAWETHKAQERADAGVVNGGDNSTVSLLDGVAKGYPALLRAEKLQKRAALVGFDWPATDGALAKLKEELAELEREIEGDSRSDAIEDELGDVLFSAVNLARKLEISAETALRRGNAKFEDRFRSVELALKAAGKLPEEVELNEMEALWQATKSKDFRA